MLNRRPSKSINQKVRFFFRWKQADCPFAGGCGFLRCGFVLLMVDFRSGKGKGMHLNVLLTGRLSGMGHEAACEVMAKRTPSHSPTVFAYSEPVVIHAPADLPEGVYTLHFENVSMPVLHKGVLWLVNAHPAADAELGKSTAGPPRKAGRRPVMLARRLIRDRRGKN